MSVNFTTIPNNSSSSSKPSSTPNNSGTAGTTSGNQTGENANTTISNWTVAASPSDQNTYRLDVSSTITVPAELQNNESLNTAEKIENLIRNNLSAKGISNENIRVYDVTLQLYTNGTWQNATTENFPAEGVTVTVPYPAGTDSSYNFVANHLFTKSMNGYPAGHVESFPENGEIRNTDAGISFTVHGLSPISIGWSKASSTAVGSTSTNASPKTGDHTPIMFYMVLMILAATAIITVYVRRIRTNKR